MSDLGGLDFDVLIAARLLWTRSDGPWPTRRGMLRRIGTPRPPRTTGQRPPRETPASGTECDACQRSANPRGGRRIAATRTRSIENWRQIGQPKMHWVCQRGRLGLASWADRLTPVTSSRESCERNLIAATKIVRGRRRDPGSAAWTQAGVCERIRHVVGRGTGAAWVAALHWSAYGLARSVGR